MRADQYIGFLGRFRGPERSTRDGHMEYRYRYCPFCKYTNWTFYVSESGTFYCHHCRRGGTIKELDDHLGVAPIRDHFTMPVSTARDNAGDLEEFKQLHRALMDNAEALAFVKRRGISEKTMRDLLLGLAERKIGDRFLPCIAIPYIDGEEVVTVKYRCIREKAFVRAKGTASPLYREAAVRGKKIVHLCEGEFDAIMLVQAGYDACSVPNGASAGLDTIHKEALSAAERIYIWGDNDAPGMEFAERTAKALGVGRARIVRLPEGIKDVNDLYLDDPPRFEERIRALIEEAEAQGLEGFKSLADLLNEFRERLSAGAGYEQAMVLPWNLDRPLILTQPGDIIALQANHTKAGKTTLVKQICLYNARRGRTVVYCATETTEEDMAKMIIAEVANTDRESIRPGDVDTALGLLDGAERRFHFGRVPSGRMHQACRFIEDAVQYFSPDILVIDFVHQITGEDPERQSQFIIWLVRHISPRYKPVVIMVGQPRKHGRGDEVPDTADYRGSSMFGEGAAHILTLYREREKLSTLQERNDSFKAESLLIRNHSRRPGPSGDRITLVFNGSRAMFAALSNDNGVPF